MKMTGVAGSITPKGDFSRFVELGVVLPAEPIERPHYSALDAAPVPFSDCPLMICYPEKLVDEAVALFGARFQMHQRVYTHQVVKQVEFMISDALILADPYIDIPGEKTACHPDGLYKMSECIENMEAFSKLTDSIIDVISLAPLPKTRNCENLLKAKELITRINNRDLYTCVGQTSFISGDSISSMPEADIADDILSYCSDNVDSSVRGNTFLFDDNCSNDDCSPSSKVLKRCQDTISVDKSDIIVEKMHLHHGLKGKNPVDRLRFYPKRLQQASSTGERIIGKRVDEAKYETLLPRRFEQRAVRVFCKSPRKADAVRRAFSRWCDRVNAHSPFPSASFPPESEEDDTIC